MYCRGALGLSCAMISISPWIPLGGLLLSLASWLALMVYLGSSNMDSLYRLGGIYIVVILAELLFSQRRCICMGKK